MTEYQKMTRDELRKVAKEAKVKGWYNMTKEQLVSEVEKAEAMKEPEVKEDKKEVKNEVIFDRQDKDNHIDSAPLGSIVAFNAPEGKTISAMIVARSKPRKMLKLCTSYGKEYIVPYDTVIWVKNHKTDRWPKGVLMVFNGNKRNEK